MRSLEGVCTPRVHTTILRLLKAGRHPVSRSPMGPPVRVHRAPQIQKKYIFQVPSQAELPRVPAAAGMGPEWDPFQVAPPAEEEDPDYQDLAYFFGHGPGL